MTSNVLTKGFQRYSERLLEFKWILLQQNKQKKFYNCNKKRLPSYSSLSKESEEDKKPEKLFPVDSASVSSQSKFKLKKTAEKYSSYCERNKDLYPNETLENSFTLLNSIKNYLTQDSSRNIYGQEIPDRKPQDQSEFFSLARMVWPEVMNGQLLTKKEKNLPLTGIPNLKKTKVNHPCVPKVCEEIVQITHVPPQSNPVPRSSFTNP
jgi:hypothetical protein